MKKKIMVFGTFDLLHPGHLFVLTEAGKRGNVTAIVARARNVERIKGTAPSQNDEKRVEAVRKAFPAYSVRLGDPEDFLAPVRAAAPDLILLGYDQKLPPGITEKDLASARVERLPAFHPELYKTTIVRRGRD